VSDEPPIERRHLLGVDLAGAPPVARVEVARVELEPSQTAGRHRHPCAVVGQVLEGTIRFQIEGEEKQLLEAGRAFYEPAGVTIACFDNASAVRPAVFSAFYLLSPGEDRLIEML
jgi:quercetin dioxygenase-like cupin family protein